MGLGDFFGKLFGGASNDAPSGSASEGDPVEFEGYTIRPAPIAEGGQFRTAGFIEREIDGEARRTRFIRADHNASRDAAIEHSVQKARQIIREQGDSLFERDTV